MSPLEQRHVYPPDIKGGMLAVINKVFGKHGLTREKAGVIY